MISQLPMRWTGDGFDVLPPSRAKADAMYVIGEVYSVAGEEQRSEKSHGHEFAAIGEIWKTLPENLADEYPSAEHLRKRALIQAGYYDEQIIDAGSNAAALRVATGVRSFPGELFSLVIVRGPFVVVRRPQSQSKRAMGKEKFQKSKQAVLDILTDMIGVPRSNGVETREGVAT